MEYGIAIMEVVIDEVFPKRFSGNIALESLDKNER